jgi:hypothetical protein
VRYVSAAGAVQIGDEPSSGKSSPVFVNEVNDRTRLNRDRYREDCRLTFSIKRELSIKTISRIGGLKGDYDCGGKARGYGSEGRRRRAFQC